MKLDNPPVSRLGQDWGLWVTMLLIGLTVFL